MAMRWKLGKLGLIAWLLAPVALVAVLWTQMDRSRGKPDPSLLHRASAPVAPPAAPAQPPEPRPEPRMVEPESLDQGFVIVVDDQSKIASPSSPIFLASSHNGWNPSDPTQKLTARSDGRWQMVIAKPRLDSRIAFKFTRGNWDTVEISADSKDVENRLLPTIDASKLAPGEQPIIEFTVPKWADQKPRGADAEASSPYRAIKVAGGRIQRLQVVGGGVPITRDLLVWLPPGYDDAANAARTYAVLYMHDGQNIFDQSPGVAGEWKADETVLDLIAKGTIDPLIIVGIPNAGKDRIREYLPSATPGLPDIDPRGDAYVDFLVTQVIPRVERTFRVNATADHRAIGGSSLGGLISLYAGLKHPDIFSKVLAESPSLHLRSRDTWRAMFDGFTITPAKVWIAMGTDEGGDDATESNAALVTEMGRLSEWMQSRPNHGTMETLVDNGARHTEAAWANRLPRAITFLFGK